MPDLTRASPAPFASTESIDAEGNVDQTVQAAGHDINNSTGNSHIIIAIPTYNINYYISTAPECIPHETSRQARSAWQKISRIRDAEGSSSESANPEIFIEGTPHQRTSVLNVLRSLGHAQGLNILLDPDSSADYLAPKPPNPSGSVRTLSSSDEGLGGSQNLRDYLNSTAVEALSERAQSDSRGSPNLLAPPPADLRESISSGLSSPRLSGKSNSDTSIRDSCPDSFSEAEVASKRPANSLVYFTNHQETPIEASPEEGLVSALETWIKHRAATNNESEHYPSEWDWRLFFALILFWFFVKHKYDQEAEAQHEEDYLHDSDCDHLSSSFMTWREALPELNHEYSNTSSSSPSQSMSQSQFFSIPSSRTNSDNIYHDTQSQLSNPSLVNEEEMFLDADLCASSSAASDSQPMRMPEREESELGILQPKLGHPDSESYISPRDVDGGERIERRRLLVLEMDPWKEERVLETVAIL